MGRVNGCINEACIANKKKSLIRKRKIAAQNVGKCFIMSAKNVYAVA